MAEVDRHLVESGEDPLESFGTPERYAARLLRSPWPTVRFVVGMITGIAGGTLVGGAAGEATATVRGSDVLLGAVLLVTCGGLVLPALHNWLPRDETRMLVGIPAAVLAAMGATALASEIGLDERVLLTTSSAGALAVGLGLVTVTVVTTFGPYLWRRLRAPGDPSPGARS